MKDSSIGSSRRLEYLLLAALLAIALLIRFIVYPLHGYKNDMDVFVVWLKMGADGVTGFYDRGFCDYPPFNVYLFWLFGTAAARLSLFGTDAVSYVVKLIPTVFDMALTLLVFDFMRRRASLRTSLLSSAIVALNPAVVFNSAIWGQFDSIYTFFLLASFILLLSDHTYPAAAVFTLAVLTKPQSAALAPLMAYLIYKKYGLNRMLISTLPITATTLLVVLPINWWNPLYFLKIYLGGYGAYPYTSVNAFNIWGLIGIWKPDYIGFLFLTPFTVGWMLFAVATFTAIYQLDKHWRRDNDALVYYTAFLILFCFFMLPTRIHERYLYPSLLFLTLLTPFLRQLRPLYVVLTATLLVNLSYALYTLNNLIPIDTTDPVVLTVSATNLMVFVYAFSLVRKTLDAPEISLQTSASPSAGMREVNLTHRFPPRRGTAGMKQGRGIAPLQQ